MLGRLPTLSLSLTDLLMSLPEFLWPQTQARASEFNVLYMDEELRVTRGNRQELRIFTRV